MSNIHATQTERTRFTNKRITDLFRDKDYKLLLDLEKKWGHYGYIPIDIPRIEDPALAPWYFERYSDIIKIAPDATTNKTGHVGPAKSVDVYIEGYNASKDRDAVWTRNVQPEFMTDFKHLYEQVMDLLPIKKLNRLQLWSTWEHMGLHRDWTWMTDLPNCFRIMMYDENPSSTMFVKEVLPDETSPRYPKEGIVNVARLDETNTFIWNNLRTKHESLYIPGYRKILMILQDYEIDWKKYDVLMERSKSKYDHLALKSKFNINDFVNYAR